MHVDNAMSRLWCSTVMGLWNTLAIMVAMSSLQHDHGRPQHSLHLQGHVGGNQCGFVMGQSSGIPLSQHT